MVESEEQSREIGGKSRQQLIGEIANARWLRCFGALVLMFLGTWLLNQYIFPRFALVFGMAREVATIGSCCAYLTVAIAASLRPDAFKPSRFTVAAIGILIAGLALVALGLATANPSSATLALTEPRAFLPYSHILFVSFFVFRIAYGFSLMFGESDGMPQITILAFLPLALVAVQAVVAGKAAPADILYQVASLFILAGFLCVLVPQFSGTSIPNVLLAAGADCFSVLVYYTLAAIGRRNPLHALPIFAWGQFATSTGTLVGTSLGHLTNGLLVAEPLLVPGAVVLVVLAFSAFNLLALRTFSFEATIEGIETVPLLEPAAEPEDERADAIDRQCARIAERFSLTERETDVFRLLAKGRNVPFIEEELIISRNTIKTHIKHIYQKMDLHSQQELIDMVETY